MSSVELLSVHNFVTEIQHPKWKLKVQCLGGTNLSHGSYISVGSLSSLLLIQLSSLHLLHKKLSIDNCRISSSTGRHVLFAIRTSLQTCPKIMRSVIPFFFCCSVNSQLKKNEQEITLKWRLKVSQLRNIPIWSNMLLLPLLHFDSQIINIETNSMDLIMCLNHIPAHFSSVYFFDFSL